MSETHSEVEEVWRPDIELVSAKYLAWLLNVTSHQARVLARREEFPQPVPVAGIEGVNIYWRSEVDQWAEWYAVNGRKWGARPATATTREEGSR